MLVGYINNKGEEEAVGSPPARVAREKVVSETGASEDGRSSIKAFLSESDAAAYLHRAASECGQMHIHTADGGSSVFFAGIADPERVLVQVFPRAAEAALETWMDIPTLLCSLDDARTLLAHIYQGETTEHLSAHLADLKQKQGAQPTHVERETA